MVDLTIGMAVYNDFDGVYFTLQALRLYHDLDNVELLVVDNYGCQHTKSFVEGWAKGRYILATEATGTAAPRDLVFREAQGEAVLCCDSHVLFAPGTIARLKDYYRNHPVTRDLLQGPIVYDDLQSISTHFDPVWRAQMWGIWATDPRGLDPEGEPFDIPMQGLGVFSCRKDAWLGFNPAFRGFGGEEGYIHEKFRQAGARTLCLPWFRWGHRFSRPGRVTYRLTVEDKLRNYIIGHTELGLDLAPVLEHFSEYLPAETLSRVTEEVLRDQTTMTRKEEAQGKKKRKEKKGKKTKKHGGSQDGDHAELEITLANEVLDDVTLADLTDAYGGALPLVSCICPTYARPPERQYLIEEAIESFLRQTYPNKELIVLNDCPEQELVCDAPGVRVVNAPKRFPSLGDKRNAGVLLSAGEFIAPWDDDDISLPWRLSHSVARLREGDYYNPFLWWLLDGSGLHLSGGCGLNMSMFRRSAWESVGGHPSITLGEDQVMHQRLRDTVRFVSEAQAGLEEWPADERYYIYRWGVSQLHLSTQEESWENTAKLPIEPGRFELHPHWRTEYDAEIRLFLNARAAESATEAITTSSIDAQPDENIDLFNADADTVRHCLKNLSELEAVRRVLRTKEAAVIIEAGVHAGDETRYIVDSLPSAPALYFGFEPDPRCIERIKSRGLPDGVQLIEAALGATDGSATMWLSEWAPGLEGTSSSLRKPTEHLVVHPHVSFPTQDQVQVLSLDSFATEKGIDRVDLLFSDIQGGERDLIAGGRETLARTKFWFTEAVPTPLYEGMWTRDEILANLPGWEVVAQYRNDMLLMNTAPIVEVSPTPLIPAAQYHPNTLATVIKELYTPYETALHRFLPTENSDYATNGRSLRVVSDHSWWAIGNRLLGSMAALHVAACIDAPSVEGLCFPEFGFETAKGAELENPLHIGGIGINVDLSNLRTVVQSGAHDGVVVNAYGQRLEYFIAQRAFWQPLVSNLSLDIPRVADDEVVIHIRCGDKRRTGRNYPIGSLGSGYEYSPLPIDFYVTVIEDLGLSPVFVGQVDDDEPPYREYIESLHHAFPRARFIAGSATEDWELIRRAKNKVIAISTFSWTAAWLGPDDSRIVMPIAGFMNPSAWPEFDFIPRGDQRYTFRWVHVIPHGPKMSLDELLGELSRHSHGYPIVYKACDRTCGVQVHQSSANPT